MRIKGVTKLSKQYNRSEDYFASMKVNCPEKFNFIFSFDKNPFKSVTKYCEHIQKLQNDIQYFLYEDEQEFKLLIRKTYPNTKNVTMGFNSFMPVLFKIDPLELQYRSILKLKEVKRLIDVQIKNKKSK